MLAPVTHIIPLTKIRRARLLPTKGRVVVQVGQGVVASDVVAEARLQNQHTLVDVQRALNLDSAAETRKLIDRKLGERVQEGDVIAETGKIFRRVVRAPVNGVIVMISSGQVLIEADLAPLRLKAGMEGEIIEVIPEQGVLIETNGALVQGVWGNGQINQGMLVNLAKSADEELTPAKLDVSMRGSVVLGGWCSQPETLAAAAQLPLRGLILGAITPNLIPAAEQAEFPILVTEGFGQMGINNIAHKLLATNEQRNIAINATPWNAYSGERPEAVITLPAPGDTTQEVDVFSAGQTVRVLTPPFVGKTGILAEILGGMTTLDNGLRARAATIRLETGQEATVALANLDVLK